MYIYLHHTTLALYKNYNKKIKGVFKVYIIIFSILIKNVVYLNFFIRVLNIKTV